jgi:Zn-dependent M16 (insulinase) family peptidase
MLCFLQLNIIYKSIYHFRPSIDKYFYIKRRYFIMRWHEIVNEDTEQHIKLAKKQLVKDRQEKLDKDRKAEISKEKKLADIAQKKKDEDEKKRSESTGTGQV